MYMQLSTGFFPKLLLGAYTGLFAALAFDPYDRTEWLDRSAVSAQRFVIYLFPLFTIAFVAMSYEIIEWWFAVSSDPNAGGAFLGSQGDIWDAQKDMLADTLGALAVLVFYAIARLRRPVIQ